MGVAIGWVGVETAVSVGSGSAVGLISVVAHPIAKSTMPSKYNFRRKTKLPEFADAIYFGIFCAGQIYAFALFWLRFRSD